MKQKILTLFVALLTGLAAWAHDFEVDGIYYGITSSTDLTVYVSYKGDRYNSYSNEYRGAVVIPESVTYSGKTYSVTKIGSEAFSGCSGLTSVVIPSSVTKIDNYAFIWCRSLRTIVCNIEIPLSIHSNMFESGTTARGVLYVPAGCVDAYKAAKVWTTFANIREIDATVAIDNTTIKDTNTADVIYNLRGQKVDSNYKGIVIKNGKKVLIK